MNKILAGPIAAEILAGVYYPLNTEEEIDESVIVSDFAAIIEVLPDVIKNDEEKLDRYVLDRIKETREFVKNNNYFIKTVAEALIEKRKLYYEDVLKISKKFSK